LTTGLGGLLAGGGVFDHAHDVALFHDQVFDAVDLDLGARPFAIGFSLAVSGMMIPSAVLFSASMRVTTTRS
jgi:hypothetical protein